MKNSIFGLKHSHIIQISFLFTFYGLTAKRFAKGTQMRFSSHTMAVLGSLVYMFSHIKMLLYIQTLDGA